MSTEQLSLGFEHSPKIPFEECHEHVGYTTMAYVPAGFYCEKCGNLISQSIPKPPEQVGYLTADWAWHLEGKEWTTTEIKR
mgnify:FL=1